MTTRCPAGHESQADDYCDTCGLAIDASAADMTPGQDAGTTPETAPDTVVVSESTCPNCQGSNPPNALFCEACGYDFTTGAMPRPVVPDATADADALDQRDTPPADANPSPAMADGWVAEIWIDPDWYADQQSSDPLPSPGVPTVVPLRHTSLLIGRTSKSRGIDPDIDIASDNGVSRRHAQLTTDGTRWFVEDLGSANGTYVGGSVGALPTTPIRAGQKTELAPDQRVYLGAWTRIVVRKAAPGEG